MIKISQIKLLPGHNKNELTKAILNTLGIHKEDLLSWSIKRRSIDARKKPVIYYVYTVHVNLKNETSILNKFLKNKKQNQVELVKETSYQPEMKGTKTLENPPVIIGSGPAGLFCAYELAKQGFAPILLERGGPVEERLKEVETFWKTGVLNKESNVQFGEGGAGTFSDGKLNTGVKDPLGRNTHVLNTLVEHGAKESILYDGKPHIGTDILIDVVKNMRNAIIQMGGTIRFHAKVTSLSLTDQDTIKGVYINETELLETTVAVLAVGHSARDTFEYLASTSITMEAKSFAVGLRVEHPQKLINESQYGIGYSNYLEPSPYKLTAKTTSGRGVYSFCMCPGGYVVNASSTPNHLVVNGMSYSKRDSKNANSAIVVTIGPQDYGTNHVLDGMKFQMELEHKAFLAANGLVPVQRLEDFSANKSSNTPLAIPPEIKGQYQVSNLRTILPEYISEAICEGMQSFGRKIRGFDAPNVILSGVETRTSSPIRILRDAQLESSIKGLYPCGEGAGYAGGITSAAMDGLKVFEAISNTYASTKK